MRLLKKILVATLVATMTVGLVGCGGSSDRTSDSTSETTKVDDIKSKGKLVLGTASGYPPFEFVSVKNNGDVIGIDVELAQAVADKIGVELEVQDMAFSELITSLQSGNCDIVIAGMPETEEKAEVVDFSEVYINDEQSIIVRAEDVDKYKSLDDFSGKTVAVEMGSSSETVANNELKGAKIDSLSLISDCFLELENSKCDAVVTGKVVGKQYVISNNKLVSLDLGFENSDKATQACVAKGESELLKLVNDVIKENQDNGNFDKWIDKYSEQASKEAAE